mmetsp:Transcript_24006/g.57957  ORF Transcript_24006/g.57957 Transcript_24006/m.57957 type:complete len:192 (-) Transcript_24006:258-833(-)
MKLNFYASSFSLTVSAIGAMVSSPPMAEAFFVAHPQGARGRSPTALNLEDHIANMIDAEMHRLDHKYETEAEWIMKQQEWSQMEPTIPSNFDFEEDLDRPSTTGGPVPGFTSGVDRSISSPRRRKDEKMAGDDPMRYCADRCVSTGNCDVFEDMFEMGPSEVMKFCEECVLSEEEDPCDVPASVFEDGMHP